MNSREILGGIIIVILIVGVIYAAVSPLVSPVPADFMEEEGKTVVTEEILRLDSVPEAEVVNLNLTVKSGGVDVNFTDDEDLIYNFHFEQDENESVPSVEYGSVSEGVLPVEVSVESADLQATFGSGCTYNGTLDVGVGGLSLALSENSKVDTFDADLMYLGGMSVEILDQASFHQLDLNINTGGLRLKVDADNLLQPGTINAGIKLGGAFVERISTGSNLGVNLAASADLGGITLNPGNFEVKKNTNRECQIKTPNYPASTNLHIDISTGLGGAMINSPTSIPTFTWQQ